MQKNLDLSPLNHIKNDKSKNLDVLDAGRRYTFDM
jgi:hypothetical protein